MRYSPRVVKAVMEHYSEEWNGNKRQIKERYNLLSHHDVRTFVDECKKFAASMGAVFVFDKDNNHFVCVDGKSDYVERLVKKTLKNHYDQGKSTRRDFATMRLEGQIGEDLNEAFNQHQREHKRIITKLSD